MKVVVNKSALLLDRWQTLELDDAAGATAVVDQGVVWITMENDRRDIVLGAGQSFEVAKNGKTLLHAETPSTLHIVEAAPRGALRSLRELARRAGEGVAAVADRWAVNALERRRVAPYY